MFVTCLCDSLTEGSPSFPLKTVGMNSVKIPGGFPYKKGSDACCTILGVEKAILEPLRLLRPKRSTAEALPRPLRVLRQKNRTGYNVLLQDQGVKTFQATPTKQDFGTSSGFFSNFLTSILVQGKNRKQALFVFISTDFRGRQRLPVIYYYSLTVY